MTLKEPPHMFGGNCFYCRTLYSSIPERGACGHHNHLHVIQAISNGAREKLLLECDICNEYTMTD